MIELNNESRVLTLGECEALLEDTIVHVAEIHEITKSHDELIKLIPNLHTMVSSMVTQFGIMATSLAGMKDAATVQAEASRSMAETFSKSESRQVRLEDENSHATDRAINIAENKNSVPMDVHKSIIRWLALVIALPMFVTLLIGIFFVLYFTKTEFKAGAGSIEIKQRIHENADLQKKDPPAEVR